MKVSDRRRGLEVLDVEDRVRFEQLVLPHLDATFNLAAWLLSSRSDAEDVTREAMLRSLSLLSGFLRGRRPGVAAADRPQRFVYVVGEESPNEADGPI
jgi:RNA polymerase sigma-70 factor (ECF subfamily)